MDDTYINIRIGMHHFQLNRDWKVRWSRNEYHRGFPDGRFAVYNFFGFGV